MPKVFISHSWEDNEISRKLAENLKRDGAEVWIDYARIEGGDSLPEVISNAIDWCDTLILVWSKSAIDSYWVKEEWTCAHALKKRIVPCLIDRSKLPSILMSRFHIDINDLEKGYSNLARALKLIIKEHKAIPQKKITKPKTEIIQPKLTKPTIFRSNPKDLSKADVKSMLNKYDFFCKEYDWNKDYCNPKGRGFESDFVLQNDGQVVLDRNTGLMWQQSGSSENMEFKDVKSWTTELNRKGFGGFNNWRLPTIEEAMSLMEPKQRNDLYIDPIFDRKQKNIWTTDQVKSALRAWVVSFYSGGCLFYYINSFIFNYVRAVRSG